MNIKSKTIPHKFRNKYLREGNTATVGTSDSFSTINTTQGSDIDILTSDSTRNASDMNVFSSLRTLAEIRDRIIAETNVDAAQTDDNVFSSRRATAETKAAINARIIKKADATAQADDNVFSSLRATAETKAAINARIIKKADNTAQTDTNVFSSLRTIKEIDTAIEDVLSDISKLYLSKVNKDTAQQVITFLKGLTAGNNAVSIDADGNTSTINLLVKSLATIHNLDVSNVATVFQTIVKDYVSSPQFIPGLMGEGMKLYKALSGDWNLEIDNVTVRKAMTTFELIISKIRAVNGGLVISAANGRIKAVSKTTGTPQYYKLEIEGDMMFAVGDLVRCKVFANGSARDYWTEVKQVSGDAILCLVSDFGSIVPTVGDDLVLFGNKSNKARQGVLYLTASEDGKPRIQILNEIDSANLSGKTKTVLGCLDGITDTDLAVQPSGYGLYSANAFLKGVFVLSTGKTVEAYTKEQANAAADAVQVGGRNYIQGSSFSVYPPKFGTTNIDASLDTSTKYLGYNSLKIVQTATPDTNLTTNRVYFDALKICNPASFSMWVKASVATNFKIRIGGNGLVNTIPISTDWKVVKVEGVTNSNSIAVVFAVDTSGTTFNIALPMLIEGNKATDWTPAPEDVATDATTKADAAKNGAISAAANDAANKYTTKTTYETGIQALSDQIKLTATKEETNALSNRLAAAELKITPDAINLTVKEQTQTIADAAKSSAISTAATDATTKANNAKNAAINTASSDAKTKADAAKNGAISAAATDAANKYTTKTTYETGIKLLKDQIALKAAKTDVNALTDRVAAAELKITPDAIKLTVKEQAETISNAAKAESKEFSLVGRGEMLYRDPTFKNGNNDTKVYNNTGNGLVSVTRVSGIAGNPNNSGYCLKIVTKGTALPGWGGFYFGTPSKANRVLITRIVAKIPVGRNLEFASNAVGNGDQRKWLTTRNGTGDWKEYVLKLVCGTSGTFSTTNFFYLSGGTTPNAAIPLEWHVAFATVYDVTSVDDTPDTAGMNKSIQEAKNAAINTAANDAASKYTTKTTYETGIKLLKDQIALKATQSDLTNLAKKVSDAELKITPEAINLTVKSQAQTIANAAAANAAKRTNVVIDATALDQNTYYPVTIAMTQTVPYTITVERTLIASFGKPSWSTHSGGFSVMCKWASNGSGWGTIGVKRVVETFDYRHASVIPVGSIGQMNNSSNEYIYVRGGSKYNVLVEGATGVAINLRTSAFTISSQTIDILTSVVRPAVDLETRPTTDEIKSQFTITPSGISLFGKTIALTGMVTFNSLASDAQKKITTAQSIADKAKETANTVVTSLNNLKTALGTLAYDDKVELAKLGTTIIEGGYIKTPLIDADTLITGDLLAGKIAATDITTGRLTVTTGAKVGGLKIEGDGLSNDGFNNDAYIILRNDKNACFAGIGGNVLPATTGTRAVARFENHNSDNAWGLGANYAMIVSAKNAAKNYAIWGTGDIVTNGAITGILYSTMTPAANTCYVIGELTANMFNLVVKFVNKNSTIGLPTRLSVSSRLGIASNTPFAIRVTIVTAPGSVEGGVYGRTSNVKGMNTSQYPLRLNNDGAPRTDRHTLGSGDIVEFMLVWDNTEYYAYLLNMQY